MIKVRNKVIIHVVNKNKTKFKAIKKEMRYRV